MVALWISLPLSVVNRVPERRTSAHTPPAGRLPGRPPGRRRPPRKTAPPAEGAGGRGVDNQRVSTQGYSLFRFYHNLSMNTCNLGKVVDGTRSTPARALPSSFASPARLSSESCRSKPLTTSLWYLVNFASKRVTRRSSSVLVLRGGKIALLIAQTSHQVVQHHSNVRTLDRSHHSNERTHTPTHACNIRPRLQLPCVRRLS